MRLYLAGQAHHSAIIDVNGHFVKRQPHCFAKHPATCRRTPASLASVARRWPLLRVGRLTRSTATENDTTTTQKSPIARCRTVQNMYSFLHDYSEAARPRLLQARFTSDASQQQGYARDVHCQQVRQYSTSNISSATRTLVSSSLDVAP